MAKTWNVKLQKWVDDKTGKPISQGTHKVWSTEHKKWVTIPVGSQLPAPTKSNPR